MTRTAHRGRIILLGLSVGLTLLLVACFGGDDDAGGPTTDSGGSGSNTVVTLAPPPPVTSSTALVQQPPQPPPEPPQPPPSSTQPDRTIGGQLLYTIEQGDTLYSIARQFGVGVEALIELNNIANPDVIRAGDELFIPPPE